MNHNDLLTDPRTPERILSILERYAGSIPSSGLLAGQAVCSAIRELSGKTKGVVYNDADIFVDADLLANSVAQTPSATWFGNITQMQGLVSESVFRDGYSDAQMHTSLCASYSLQAVQSSGFLQHIYVKHTGLDSLIHGGLSLPIRKWFDQLGVELTPSNTLSWLFALNVLSGFDINATRVGVCLQTLKLLYMPDFRAYGHSEQLEVVCSNTPFQSLLRVMKKHKEGVGFLDKQKLISQTKLMLFDYQALPLTADRHAVRSAEHSNVGLPEITSAVESAWNSGEYHQVFESASSPTCTEMINSVIPQNQWLAHLFKVRETLKSATGVEPTQQQIKTAIWRSAFLGRAPVLTSTSQVSLVFGEATLRKLDKLPELFEHFKVVPHNVGPFYSPRPLIAENELPMYVNYTASSLWRSEGYLPWALYGLVSNGMSGKLKPSLHANLMRMLTHYNRSQVWFPREGSIALNEIAPTEHSYRSALVHYQSTKALPMLDKWCGPEGHEELRMAYTLPIDKAYYVIGQYQQALNRAKFSDVYSVANNFKLDEWLKFADMPESQLGPVFDAYLAAECELIEKLNVLKPLKLPVVVPDEYADQFTVMELTLQNELDAESDKMHHCVRGYGDEVESRSSYIFRIRHMTDNPMLSGTLELNIKVRNTLEQGLVLTPQLAQLSSFGNKACTPEVRAVAESIIAQIPGIVLSAPNEDRVLYLGKQNCTIGSNENEDDDDFAF